MKFQGLWIDKKANEIISIEGPIGADRYRLKYNYIEGDFKETEIIPIFLSDKRHALLADSRKFGRQNIHIIDVNRFQIGNQIFEKEE